MLISPSIIKLKFQINYKFESSSVVKNSLVFSNNFNLIIQQRNRLLIIFKLTEIRLYLTFSNWFGTRRNSFWLWINQKMVNLIRFQLIYWKEIWKYFLRACLPKYLCTNNYNVHFEHFLKISSETNLLLDGNWIATIFPWVHLFPKLFHLFEKMIKKIRLWSNDGPIM